MDTSCVIFFFFNYWATMGSPQFVFLIPFSWIVLSFLLNKEVSGVFRSVSGKIKLHFSFFLQGWGMGGMLHPWHMEVPGPGIKPMPQQWIEATGVTMMHSYLLSHKETSYYGFWTIEVLDTSNLKSLLSPSCPIFGLRARMSLTHLVLNNCSGFLWDFKGRWLK